MHKWNQRNNQCPCEINSGIFITVKVGLAIYMKVIKQSSHFTASVVHYTYGTRYAYTDDAILHIYIMVWVRYKGHSYT